MSEKKTNNSFLKNFLSLGVGTFLYMVIGVIGTPIITRLVDPAEYGQMSMFTVYSNIGLMLCGLGMDQTLVRYFYRKENLDYQQRILRECLTMPGIASVILGILMLIGNFFFDAVAFHELLALEVYVIVLLLHRFAILVVRLKHHTKYYSLVNIVQKTAYIVLVVGLAFILRNHYYFILIVSNILSTWIAALLAIIKEKEVWRRSASGLTYPEPKRELIQYGLPLMFASGISMIFNAMDKIAINHYCTVADVGVYTSAMNLMAVFSIVRTSFNALWMPTAVEHYEKHPKDTAFFQRGNALISIIMVVFGAGVVLCKDLLVLLLGEKYSGASAIIPFLMFEPIMYTISETTATGIVIQKKSKYQLIVSAGACLVNLIGNTLLTPVMGPRGAALSTGISYLVFFALRTGLSVRIFHVNYQLTRFAFVIVLLMGYAFYGSTHGFDWLHLGMFLGIVAALLLAYREYIREGVRVATDWIKKNSVHHR